MTSSRGLTLQTTKHATAAISVVIPSAEQPSVSPSSVPTPRVSTSQPHARGTADPVSKFAYDYAAQSMSSLVDRSAKCNHDSDGRIAGFEMLYLHNIYGDGHTDGRTNGRIERDRSTYGWMDERGWILMDRVR